jgi:uncharacterized membrane protein YphA (DoxX/SURF4 family)
VLRIGISLVFFWFSISQFTDPVSWTGYVPAPLAANFNPLMLVYANAAFELLFGTLLILGLFTRISATLLGIHLAFIAISLGYNEIAIRDWGLAIATFAVAMHGRDRLSIKYLF